MQKKPKTNKTVSKKALANSKKALANSKKALANKKVLGGFMLGPHN
jgi:hypothetical protein